MINAIWKQKSTQKSRMFMAASKCCALTENGYIEDEYFFSGTANIYGDNGKEGLQILHERAPYTNRFVVRRPVNAAQASGRVVVEILNSSSYMDIDRVWVLTHKQIMRNSDVYVGITSKPVTRKTLKKFDAERYAPLAWDNPRECPYPAGDIGNFKGASSPDTEDGLFWDMLTELALTMREECAFLDGLSAKQIYLAGWSQSGSYMVTYTNYFARERFEMGRIPIFDGYFSAGPAPDIVPALNQCECMDKTEEDSVVRFANVPYFIMQTESENAKLGTFQAKLPQSDDPLLQYRTYDIPGATHDNFATMDAYYQGNDDEERTGIALIYPGKEPNPNDYPSELAFRAGLQCLCDWAEKRIPPPRVEAIPIDENLENIKDENGNAQKGWRLPELEAPVCRYQPRATPLRLLDDTALYGCEIPYSADELAKRYGDLARYRRIVEKKADEAIANRLLLAQDRQECIVHAVKKAKKYGLQGGL